LDTTAAERGRKGQAARQSANQESAELTSKEMAELKASFEADKDGPFMEIEDYEQHVLNLITTEAKGKSGGKVEASA
jgi:hypothetical protein